ncbi:cytochrome P450 4C1-like [Daktulosphaira vitifoliae]|uniref:cytochrome P450 4C1-like n=1 Tax=Daktulosphaira vitifoliae TaxID=58002 RepID=UPI0021AA85B5|nr:cytochrome P450 4C1-like [Daktulosphaira vitifoliae]
MQVVRLEMSTYITYILPILFIFLTVLLLLLILFKLFFKLRNNLRQRLLTRSIPGPSTWDFIKIILRTREPEKIFNFITDIFRKYENTLFKVWLGPYLCIFPTNPEYIKEMLIHPKIQKKGIFYSSVRNSFIGNSLGTIDDTTIWKRHRNAVACCFKTNNLKYCVSIMNSYADNISQHIQNNRNMNSNECEIFNPIVTMARRSIIKALFGVEMNSDERKEIVENIEISTEIIVHKILNPWFLNKYLYRFSSLKKTEEKSKRIICTHLDNIIRIIDQTRKQSMDHNFNEENISKECFDLEKKSLIETLLENGKMTLDEIRQETVFSLLTIRTVAFTNTCIIFYLAQNQDFQKKVFEEQLAIFSKGNPDRRPSYEDLQQMKFLEQVIYETLRLQTPLPIMSRRIEEDVIIGNTILPAGAFVCFNLKDLHRSPLYYKDPENFNPDHFSMIECQKRHPYAFIPFSGGLKNCVAYRLVILQIKITLSTLVRKSKFFPSDKYSSTEFPKLKYSISSTFENGCYVKLEPRQKSSLNVEC